MNIRYLILICSLLLLASCSEDKPKPLPQEEPIDTFNPAADLPTPKKEVIKVEKVKLKAFPDEVSFGSVILDTTTSRSIGIMNNSKEKLKIKTVKLYGAENLYKITGGCNTNEIINPGEACSINIAYTPIDQSQHTGEIIITYVDGLSLQIPVSGVGSILPEPPIDPAYQRALEIANQRKANNITINQNNAIIEESTSDFIQTGKLKRYPEEFGGTTSTPPVDRSRIITADRYIPAVLENTINSELNEGRVIGVVERNVYGSDGRLSLIPAGSRVIGTYSSLSKQGDTRLYVSWNRIIRPDGASILIKAEGADPMGRLGMIGHVDNRFINKYGASILTSFVSALPEYFLGDEEVSVQEGDSITTSTTGKSRATNQFSEDMSYLSRQMIKDNLKLGPIITVPQGTRLLIVPSQDIYLIDSEHFVPLVEAQPSTNIQTPSVSVSQSVATVPASQFAPTPTTTSPSAAISNQAPSSQYLPPVPKSSINSSSEFTSPSGTKLYRPE